jgi:hypothetical protein
MEIKNTTIVRFGKGTYHRRAEMIGWCEENVGRGGWVSSLDAHEVWLITCDFGTTRFYFVRPGDALAFKLIFGEACI